VVVSTLELARTETSMDVAVLGEIRDGREVVRHLAGDAQSFGLKLGASMPIEDTYCQRLLEGRLSNVVTDARTDELVRDLDITRAANVGAYIGVPLTTLNARLYVLCCLAHEQQPSLSERDVVFLRGLGETITVELDAAPLH
jgi:GAF domain-containing protein